MPPPSVLSPHGPQLQTYLARSSSPGGWPEFLLHSQVDFEALDRPLLLRSVTLGDRGRERLLSRGGTWGTYPNWVPPSSLAHPPLHPSKGNLLQEVFLTKPSLFTIYAQLSPPGLSFCSSIRQSTLSPGAAIPV